MDPPKTLAKDMCHSCGMPMKELDQRGGFIAENEFCVYCTDDTGDLKPYDAVLSGMAHFMAKSDDVSLELALERSKEYLTHMPAWRDEDQKKNKGGPQQPKKE